jgi:ABC-type nickel/cobalt efflux system permease component RcnA
VTRALRRAAVLLLGSIGILTIPAPAFAHPLGNFTINLYSGIAVVPDEIRIGYALDMAEIPTFQETQARIDSNADGVASSTEQQSWARRKAPELLAGLRLSVNGRPVQLAVESSSMAFRPGQGGLNVLRLEATFSGPAPASGSVRFEDTNYQDHVGWREITAVGADGEAVRNSSVPLQSVSDELRAYPANLLQDPLKVTAASFSFAPGESNVVTSPATPGGSGARPGVIGGSFAKLIARSGLTVPIVALSLLLAVGFGALHAIAPGHGKTLMAAYLVGAGGRVRQAIAVGGAVSLMYTASVIGLGLLVLYAESLFPRPEDVYPWLGLLSGVVAIVLGGALFTVRFRARRRAAAAAAAHDHPGQAHLADHGSGDHDHTHGDHGHVHAAPDAPVLSRKGLAALAVAGGILPSPTALVVLLAAVSLHRLVFGLALIMAFSIGLAAALIVVGVLALRARELVSRKMTSRIGQVIPLLSASAIVAVGAYLVARAVTQL